MKGIVSCLSRQISHGWTAPVFLCPALQSYNPSRTIKCRNQKIRQNQCRRVHIETARSLETPVPITGVSPKGVPWTCPGCGAYSQSEKPEEAGFYSFSRKPVKAFRSYQKTSPGLEPVKNALEFGELGVKTENDGDTLEKPVEAHVQSAVPLEPPPFPVCDRCHNLQHHNQGMPIEHPTMQAIQEMVGESPHRDNHVWHILDAADFPLSLVPKLQRQLHLAPQRGQNRRAKLERYFRGQKADMSFIITRSDLLAPRKEQVDAMMPYLIEVLREALGPDGESARLGNVKCVSSYRGWWTRQVKEEVWQRGGGQWMIGKVNVGKSQLLENIFPKNRTQDTKTLQDHVELKHRGDSISDAAIAASLPPQSASPPAEQLAQQPDFDGLLPPMPEESAFPIMPMVSHLPGTTASPIRLPFGRGKGELIDLPGLPRGNLDTHVQDKHKASLVMRARREASQLSIKPGQSLVVSNLLRITPTTPDLVFLVCPFIPLDCHVTNTEKAKAILNQENTTAVDCIANTGVNDLIASAGTFPLKWDVTRARAGPLTRKDSVALKPERLPFVVFSTDILIEGVGWIELAAQVRRSALEGKLAADHGTRITQGSSLTEPPAVEIFSPNGEHVGARKPLGAWMIGGKKKKPVSQRSQRPRPSMKGRKKAMKREMRALRGSLKGSSI